MLSARSATSKTENIWPKPAAWPWVFELGESPKITVDTNDGLLASKGDKIEVKGLALPTMPNQGQAQSVTITLAPRSGDFKKPGDPARLPGALKPKDADKGDKPDGTPTDKKTN